MKPHPIQHKMMQLRRRLRRLLVLHGACRVVVVAIPAVAVAAMLDWLVRLEDRGLRVMLTVGVVAAICWTVYRYLWPALASRLDDVTLALRIERCAPRLRNRVASGVEFERVADNDRANDDTAGSFELRSKTIERTAAAVAKISPSQIIPWEGLRTPLLQSAAVLTVALLVLIAAPTTTAIAIARLANPLGSAEWPRTNHLKFETDLDSLPRGETFEVRVVDTAGVPLPDDLRVEVRYGDDAVASATEEMPVHRVDGTAVARREDVREGFSYRAVGGDDYTMPWTKLVIVDPPQLDSLALTITPPDYTGWAAHESSADIRDLAGSTVSLTAHSDRALADARLVLDGEKDQPLVVGDDGVTVTTPKKEAWRIDESAKYRIEIEDMEGIVGGRYTDHTIEAVADRAPTVSLDEPTADLYLTAGALIPIRTTAKDDLGVRRVWLEVVRGAADSTNGANGNSDGKVDGKSNGDADSAQPSPQLVELFQNDTPGAAVSLADWSEGRRLDTRFVEYNWDLATHDFDATTPDVQPLAEGDTVELTAVAIDDLDQRGSSQRRRLRIISEDQLRARLAARQETVASELERALELERHALGISGELHTQLPSASAPTDQHRDQLRSDEASQREVGRLLAGSGGVREQLREIEEALSVNRLDGAELPALIHDLGQQIERLSEKLFPQIFDQLVEADKTIEAAANTDASQMPELMRGLGESMAAAQRMQQEAAEALADAVARLSQQASQGRLRDELVGIRREQLGLADETAQLSRDAASQSGQPAEQLKQRESLEQRQRSLADRFEKLRDLADEQDADNGTPSADSPARAILDEAARRGVQQRMREAGEQLDQGQLGRAFDSQQQVAADIDELLRMLDELDKSGDKQDADLRELAKRAGELAQKQRELTDEWQQRAERQPGESDAATDKALADKQRATAQQAGELARSLSSAGQAAAAGMSQGAASEMSAAAQSQAQGENPATSSEHAEAAKEQLDQLEEYLAEQVQQAEQDKAQQRMAELWQDLNRLRGIEDALLVETRAVDDEKAAKGRLSRSDTARLRDLAAVQQQSQTDTSEWSKTFADVPMFQWALEEAAAEMATAMSGLDQRESGSPTQTAMSEASGRLGELLDALSPPEPKEGEDEQADDGGGGGAGGGGEKEEGGVTLAELVLLKTMQLRVNRQTEALGPAPENGNANAAHDEAQAKNERAQLGERQRRLAEMTDRLREALLGNPADDDAPNEQPAPQ